MPNLDLKIFFWLNNLAGHSKILDDFFIACASSVLPYLFIIILLLLVYFSRYSKKEKITILGMAFLSAFISHFGVAEIIRFFYHHPRPFITYSVHQLIPESGWSFPSGHATFFFALAAAVYLYNKKWGWGLFLIALIITLSRIIVGVHYPSDILGGMVIGMIVAYLTVSCFRKCRRLASHTKQA
ncbi:MAG: phosphatase PAP2 family protein [Minisyncoccia bacterium]